MLQKVIQDLDECIKNLLDCDAFELQMHINENGQIDYFIPYMLNDALEYYFVLKDCQMTGAGASGHIASEIELLENEGSFALIIREPNGDISTLWFKDVQKSLKCYRYHEIGHFWVKGQEHWRQLVYIIGTIYDKFEYVGESACNVKELALLPLMEFAPFRYWSPIHESLDERYPDTLEGIKCFEQLCQEVGDYSLLKLTERYKQKKLLLSRMVQKIATELSRAGHEALYEAIYQKVCEASSQYPSRDYGEAVNQKNASERISVTETLHSKGYSGKYPHFSKGNTSVLVTEEHPFTLSVLEYDNYNFRMQFMVSETAKEALFQNQGFFVGTGNKGWIAKSVDELK